MELQKIQAGVNGIQVSGPTGLPPLLSLGWGSKQAAKAGSDTKHRLVMTEGLQPRPHSQEGLLGLTHPPLSPPPVLVCKAPPEGFGGPGKRRFCLRGNADSVLGN